MDEPRVSYGEVKKIVPRVKNLERVCKSIIYGNAGSATHTHTQVTRRERGPGVEQEKAETEESRWGARQVIYTLI